MPSSKRCILLLCFSVLALAGCAPNFPIYALKKGEVSGGPILSTNGIGACLASGATDRTTVYANTMNLVHYRIGVYHKITDAENITPEFGVNLSFGAGVISNYVFLQTESITYWGLGLHTSWRVDKATMLYAVLNGYYQPGVQYCLRPGLGLAFKVSKSGTLLQLDVNSSFQTTSTEQKWLELTRMYSFGIGLIM